MRRLEAVANAKGVPTLIFARRLLEEGLLREELILSKAYEQSTTYLEGVLTLIIGSDDAHGRASSQR